MRQSEYYNTNISDSTFEDATSFYFKWCNDNNQEPEISIDDELDDISDSQLDHVLYHAELAGFEI